MKAKINGYNLLIPKSGNAPMLFLEWIGDNSHINNLLYRVFKDENDYFSIRLNKHPSAMIEDCLEYINANL